jgi:hypothetical protein
MGRPDEFKTEPTIREKKKKKKKGLIQKFTPDMIRRVDDAPRLVNPSGFAVPLRKEPTIQPNGHLHFSDELIDHGRSRHLSPDLRGNTEEQLKYVFSRIT